MSDDFEPDDSGEHVLSDLSRRDWEDTHSPTFFLDITSGRVARPPWLFEDFLLSHSITLVSGEPFAGKSLFMSAAALSLDSGEPLFGAFQPAPYQRVMYIGQDAPTWDYIGQAQKIARGMEIRTTSGSFMLLNKGFDLMDPASFRLIEEAIDLYNINVLMLDTLLEMHNLNENDNVEMKQVMGRLKYLRNKHFLSIFISTHTAKAVEGKSANYRARGASVISGSVDQHILIRPHYGAGKADGFYFKAPKSRGGTMKQDSSVVHFGEAGTADEPILSLQFSGELYSERREVVLSALSSGPTERKAVTAALRAKYPAWSKLELERRVTNTLAYLTTKGSIRKTDRGVYTLSESLPPKGASEQA
jgi:hypothetical protein